MKLRNLPIWLKGGIIAVSIQVIVIMIALLIFLMRLSGLRLGGIWFAIMFWSLLIAFSPSGILIELNIFGAENDILGVILSIIIYFIFGVLIGWIVGKIKSKKKF